MIEIISSKKVGKIIDTRRPYGLLLLLSKDDTFTGIDNSSGQAFTEDL
ncbi:hypothetical protein ACJDU8_07455 [Clostridium sp. WILCCON 0269]|uniref:Uncharacterized protein n=1 Tax=Candidatus Clostridium eludens TaxID=3381663 RepID=A0ABW8SHA9_9CLOT